MNSVAPGEQEPKSGPRTSESGERKAEKAPASQRGDFGFGGMKELQRLEKDAAEARALADADPSNEKLQQRAETREMRVELFGLVHDQGGAFKFSGFGREVVKMFEAAPGKEPVIAIDPETGKLELAESQKDRRFMMVSMGELQRLNKEGGGHAAGDAALKETVRAIESSALSTMGAEINKADIQILRYGSNEYMVSVKGMSDQQVETMMDGVRNHWNYLEGVSRKEKLSEIGVKEPPPLNVSAFDFKEVVDIMSDAQLELDPDQRISQGDPNGAARETIDALRLHANYLMDMQNFRTGVERIRETLNNPEKGIDQARELFAYLSKMYEAPLNDARAFGSLPDKVVDQLAKEYAAKNLTGAQKGEQVRQAAVDAQAAIVERRVQEMRVNRAGTVYGPKRMIAAPNSVPLAEVPERTDGQNEMDMIRVASLDAAKKGDQDDKEHAEVSALKELEKRDAGTGLETRQMYYRKMQDGFESGRKMSAVFIDMAFLKYFDKNGGSDAGDNAIKMSASILEKTLEQFDVDGEAFRYAGDEFTVLFDGDAEVADKFRELLMQKVSEAGAIPVGKNETRGGYQPTELVFNCGVADSAMTEQVYADLVAAGVYSERDLQDPDRVLNEKANLMTIIADKGVERPKAIDRFVMLINSLQDPTYATNAARKEQVDGIMERSKKAVFGEDGIALVKQWAAEGRKAEEVLPQIERWVDAQMAKEGEQKNRKHELTGKLIELHGDLNYYKQALDRALDAEVVTSMELNRIKAERDRLEEERQVLLGVRKTLS